MKAGTANAMAWQGLARCQMATGDLEEAVRSLRSSLGLIFHSPSGHYLLGKVLLQLGATEEGVASLKRAIEQNPIFPKCHRLLAEIFRQTQSPEKAKHHEELAVQAEGRLRDFQKGKELPTDRDLELDVMLSASTGIGEIKNDTDIFELDQTVVIVSGLPRSGTSMMMQMLSAGGLEVLGDGERRADESNRRGYFEYGPVKRLATENQWLNDATGKLVKVVTPLLPCLPKGIRYRVIYMSRPLAEVINSQKKMLERMGKTGATVSDRQLAASLKKGCDFARKHLEANPNVQAISVHYHAALEDPVSLARRVNEFLGGTLDEEAMASAVDPGLCNERKSIRE